MAKICLGILDGFIGKVGTVVGSFWKGKAVMRAYKKKVHDRGSKKQVEQRMRFATIGSLSSAFLDALRLGLHAEAQKRRITEADLFVKKNLQAVEFTWPDTIDVDYTLLELAAGSLGEVSFGSPQFDEPLTVAVSFGANSDLPGVSEDDQVYLFVYNPGDGRGLLSQAVRRNAGSVSITVPNAWNGETVHVWGFAVNAAGVSSNSHYIGNGSIS
jgi:hypothetical protein